MMERVTTHGKLVQDVVAQTDQERGHFALAHRGQDLVCANGSVVQRGTTVAQLVEPGLPRLELTPLERGALEHAWLLIFLGGNFAMVSIP